MNKSESIKELSLALSQFQGEVEDAPKTKEVKSESGKGPSYKHAELSGILEIACPLLRKNGLSVVQLPGSADDKITLETVLMHSSGEYISSTIVMPIDPPELISGTDKWGNKYENRRKGLSHPQEVGKYITYARRYALAAILGIAQVDDEESMIQTKVPQQKPKNVWAEEIKELILKYYPGQTEGDQKCKGDLLEKFFDTRYWTKVESLESHILEQKFMEMKEYLYHSENKEESKKIDIHQLNDILSMVNNDEKILNYILQKCEVEALSKLTEEQYVSIRDELRILNVSSTNE